jgi:hypothetical protein
MFSSDPGSFLSHPGSNNSKKGGEKISFLAINFTKLKIMLSSYRYRKHLSQFTKKFKVFFNPKIVAKLSELWGWDSKSGIRKKPLPDPGIKKPPYQDPQHCVSVSTVVRSVLFGNILLIS